MPSPKSRVSKRTGACFSSASHSAKSLYATATLAGRGGDCDETQDNSLAMPDHTETTCLSQGPPLPPSETKVVAWHASPGSILDFKRPDNQRQQSGAIKMCLRLDSQDELDAAGIGRRPGWRGQGRRRLGAPGSAQPSTRPAPTMAVDSRHPGSNAGRDFTFIHPPVPELWGRGMTDVEILCKKLDEVNRNLKFCLTGVQKPLQ